MATSEVFDDRVNKGAGRSLMSSALINASRAFDILVAVVAAICFAPTMLVVALCVWVQDGGPVLYAQFRIGREGKRFRCLKFRSMFTDSAERLAEMLACDAEARAEWARDHKLRNDPRVTPVGLFIRKLSLDELPQIFNVLRGEMSVVGPRPIVDAEVCKYGRYFEHYCSVTPGITGLWQVSGRNDVSYRRRVAMDVTYARSKSLAFDLYLLAATVPAVILSKGSY
jgi:lipopolysaccharide/colanic/teichoic acid biosynthesis glycosyltransferase